jgi:GNAT superfamily N-acetyltransferase
MKTNFDEIIKNFKTAKLTFAGEDKEYFLIIKEDVVGDRLRLNYTLESGYDKVAKISLYYVLNDERGIKKWNSFGYKEVPESMFEIDHFYVEPKFRNAGIGTAFFNIVMQNIVDFDNAKNLHSKLVFVKMNTPEATAFFNKWNARENANFLEDSQSTILSIIDKPCVVPAKNFIATPITPELQ